MNLDEIEAEQAQQLREDLWSLQERVAAVCAAVEWLVENAPVSKSRPLLNLGQSEFARADVLRKLKGRT